jgi:hypothetical protein
MATNYTVTTARFTPFSFDEILKPYQIYNQEYNRQEESLGDLNTKTSIWDNIIDPIRDERAYKVFKGYSDELESLAGSLARGENLNNTRRALNKLKRDYGRIITPIESAYTSRANDTKTQREARLKDPSLMFSRDAAVATLEDYINNPNLSYNSVSGNNLYEQALRAGKAAAEQTIGEELIGGPDGYLTYMKKQGLDDTTVNNWLKGGKNDYLDNLVNQIISTSDISNLNPADQLRALDYIKTGIASGIGYDSNKQFLRDYNYNPNTSGGRIGSPNYTGVPWREVSRTNIKSSRELRDDLDFINGIDKGIIDITQPDYSVKAPTISGGFLSQESYPRYDKVKRLLDKYGIKNSLTRDPKTGNIEGSFNIDDLRKALEKDIKRSGVRDTEYILNMADNALLNKYIMDALFVSSSGDDNKSYIKELDEDLIPSDDYIDVKDVIPFINNNTTYSYLPGVGFRMTGSNEKEGLKRFWLDPEILTNETLRTGDNIVNAYQLNMDIIDDLINSDDFESPLVKQYIGYMLNDLINKSRSFTRKQSITGD